MRQLTEEERCLVTSLALKKLVLVFLQNHMFSYDNRIYRQSLGEAIGDQQTGSLGVLVDLVTPGSS